MDEANCALCTLNHVGVRVDLPRALTRMARSESSRRESNGNHHENKLEA
jgi:hypothetical protein